VNGCDDKALITLQHQISAEWSASQFADVIDFKSGIYCPREKQVGVQHGHAPDFSAAPLHHRLDHVPLLTQCPVDLA